MSDDSFIREVEEELRNERLQNFWRDYGTIIIGVALAVVLGTAAWRGYEYYQRSQAESAGDAFMSAIRLADQGKQDEALSAFEAISAEGTPAYRALAKMRVAAEFAKNGKADEAVKSYDAVAEDSDVQRDLRDLAKIRAAMVLVDHGTPTQVNARVGGLAGAGQPYRSSAREALALSYLKANDLENTARYLGEILKDGAAPPTLKQRAELLSEVVVSRGGPAVER